MKKALCICLLFWLLRIVSAWAQTTPFTANWHFEGNSSGISSTGLVAASVVTYTGVNLLAVSQYSTGYVGLGANVQNWSTTLCNQTEYVQFSVQPLGTATITLASLSFAVARSAQGPQQLTVRSSVDGFSNNLLAQSITTSYQIASIALTGAGFSNQSNAITFRIYGCNPTDGGGTLKIDEIQINAAVLPVTLLSFTAQPEGDRVQLAWSTTSEYNANRFVVERSRDLGEYTIVGEVTAKGTTDSRQYYGLTDLNPQPGINYYRLKQIDHDGTFQYVKPISVILRSSEPVISVYPNPASPDQIHVRLWNADNAKVQLLTASGQLMQGLLDKKAGEADLTFAQPLPMGLYWLNVEEKGQRYIVKVLIDR